MSVQAVKNPDPWKRLSAAAILSAYFCLAMEWLFFATKPSFLSALSWKESLSVLLRAPLVVVLPLLAVVLICWLGNLALSSRAYRRVVVAVARLGPALVLACSGLLLVDNFMVTVFDLGIRSSEGLGMVPYELLFALLLAGIYWYLSTWDRRSQNSKPLFIFAGLMVGGSILSVSMGGAAGLHDESEKRAGDSRWPNILILSSDGLSAEHMSVYGYERETTPFLKELASQALICENAFSNARSTAGSTVSLLTGKLPTRTRVLYSPDILRGKDAYQHFPLLLRNRGYHSIHLSIRHYADVYDFNLLESFDSSNFRTPAEFQIWEPLAVALGLETSYFLAQVRDRISSRLLHLFYLQPMEDVYAEVVKPRRIYQRDSKLLAELHSFLDSTPLPFFAHVHLMGSHGGKFRPADPFFSLGKVQSEAWMNDFYDDAIRDFDRYTKEIYGWLKTRSLLDETLIVIHSDHSIRGRRSDLRIPLLIRFPGGKPSTRLRENCQNLDIVPTILDYLDMEAPDWMRGRSLIASGLDPFHPILIAGEREAKAIRDDRWEMDPDRAGPPFFSLGSLSAIIGDRIFRLDLQKPNFEVSRVNGHTAVFDENKIPSPTEVQRLLLSHLSKNGYDISSLQRPRVDEEVR